MVRFEVTSSEVTVKQGVSARTGKDYCIREQEAWGWFCGPDGVERPHPERVRISLEDKEPPYPVGRYFMSPKSVYVDRFKQVSCRLALIPAEMASGSVTKPEAVKKVA
jgi:hypothetical protein